MKKPPRHCRRPMLKFEERIFDRCVNGRDLRYRSTVWHCVRCTAWSKIARTEYPNGRAVPAKYL